jgi:hypothetical protein
MELKHVNPNNENVVASNLNQMDFLFFLNCKNQVWKQTSYVVFFLRHALPTRKTKLHIIFTSLM